MCAAQPDNKILGQCLLVGLEVARSGLSISGYGGVYQYLRPLTTAEALATLTEYLTREKLFTPGDADKLMAHPIVRTQIALAGGLPQLITFLSEALEDPETLRSLRAALSAEKESR